MALGRLTSLSATPTEPAEVVHAMFTQHFGFSRMYELVGFCED